VSSSTRTHGGRGSGCRGRGDPTAPIHAAGAGERGRFAARLPARRYYVRIWRELSSAAVAGGRGQVSSRPPLPSHRGVHPLLDAGDVPPSPRAQIRGGEI
jgi:hypothetical protein